MGLKLALLGDLPRFVTLTCLEMLHFSAFADLANWWTSEQVWVYQLLVCGKFRSRSLCWLCYIYVIVYKYSKALVSSKIILEGDRDFFLIAHCHWSITFKAFNCYFHIGSIGRFRRHQLIKSCQTLVHALIITRIDHCNALVHGLLHYVFTWWQRAWNIATLLIYSLKTCKRVISISCAWQKRIDSSLFSIV